MYTILKRHYFHCQHPNWWPTHGKYHQTLQSICHETQTHSSWRNWLDRVNQLKSNRDFWIANWLQSPHFMEICWKKFKIKLVFSDTKPHTTLGLTFFCGKLLSDFHYFIVDFLFLDQFSCYITHDILLFLHEFREKYTSNAKYAH